MHDNPKVSISHDLFKRGEFALRIANLIRNRDDIESIALGINGAWGDGKTTVLNFITEELIKDYPRTIIIKFNPWRFSEESKLLESFFHTISKDLAKSLDSEEKKVGMTKFKRKEDFKKISQIFADYGEAISELPIPAFNWVGKAVSTAGKKFSSSELEDKKIQLSQLLLKYKRKIVVVIDDIDRLAKDEVYSIFRLVKLTADFNHFTYLLAYDDNMVAAAIGNRFGDGDPVAGRNFLEKIVQVPIKLPEINVQELYTFFSESFEKILSDNKVVIDEVNKERFEEAFSNTLLFNLDSPRKIVRYCNTLQFSIPLMLGEVNVVDLIFFEGIKVFFPKHYEFIRDNSHFFIYDLGFYNDVNKQEFENAYNKLNNALTEREKKTIKGVLRELFPTLKKIWENTTYPVETYQQWDLDKRIVSKSYFSRYLTYSLLKSDVSDKAFENFLLDLKRLEPNESTRLLVEFSKQFEIGGVLRKLRLIENRFKNNEAIKIAKAIAQAAKSFPHYEGFMTHSVSPFSQAAIFIAHLILNIDSKEEQFQIANDLMIIASTFEFAYEINYWIRVNNKKTQIFTEPQFLSLGEVLKDRCVQESSPESFLIKYPKQAGYLIKVWSILNKKNIQEYLKQLIQGNSQIATSLLEAISGKTYVLGSNNAQQSDLTEDTFLFLKETIEVDWLYSFFEQKYGKDYTNDVILETKFYNQQSSENIIKQFMYWFEKSNMDVG